MMTISKQGVAIITIAFLTFAAVVSTTLNLITGGGNRNDDVPSSSSNFGNSNSNSNTTQIRSRTWPKSKSKSTTRDLSSSILPREVGEVPIDVQESIDPHLIDFVVGGFPKCGTTYLQNKILYPSERLFIPHHETHFLQSDKYSEFVAEFDNVTKKSSSMIDDEANYSDTNVDDDDDDDSNSGQKEIMVVGYKAPFELGHETSLRNLETLFPDVGIIITLRHPVLQFESLYNYKLRKHPTLIPTVENFIGVCGELCPEDNDNDNDNNNDERRETSAIVSTVATEQVKKTFDNEDDFRSFLSSTTKDASRVSEFNAKKVVTKKVTTRADQRRCVGVSDVDINFCTGESNYHMYLSRLGLTPMDTPEELALLDHHKMPIHDFSSKGDDSVDSDSDGDVDGDKAKLFLIEIGQFDNRKNQTMADDVVTDLETFLGLDVGDLPRAPHRNGERPKTVYDYPEDRKGQILDICLERYEPLREILLDTSRNASKWIIDYLLRPSNRGRVVVSNIDMFVSMVEEWKIDPCLE